MHNNIHTELDPFFETIGLLLVSGRVQQAKQDLLDALSQHVLDAEGFYNKHLMIYDRYVAAFEKYKVADGPQSMLASQEDDDFALILLSLLCANRDDMGRLDTLTDSVINTEIIAIYNELFSTEALPQQVETMDDIIAFWDSTTLSQSAKWQLTKLMQSPKAHVVRIMKQIEENLPAFEQAYDEIKQPIKKLTTMYQNAVTDKQNEVFSNLVDSFPEASAVYPTLAIPISMLIISNRCYYGLLTPLVTRNGNSPYQTEQLLSCLKALSDSSKLSVLRSLKESSKYNLEIAQQLGLTAATMSHHLNALLTCGFVGIKRQGNRIYYYPQTDALRAFITALEQELL